LDAMQASRRNFLRMGLVGLGMTAGATSWLATSKRRATRLFRTMLADAKRRVPPAPFTPDPNQWSENSITISWLGHATALISFYGIRILTDPTLGNRIGVSLGVGTVGIKRYISPALSFKKLPAIDVVLLSHAHMDHMDLGSLARFP